MHPGKNPGLSWREYDSLRGQHGSTYYQALCFFHELPNLKGRGRSGHLDTASKSSSGYNLSSGSFIGRPIANKAWFYWSAEHVLSRIEVIKEKSLKKKTLISVPSYFKDKGYETSHLADPAAFLEKQSVQGCISKNIRLTPLTLHYLPVCNTKMSYG